VTPARRGFIAVPILFAVQNITQYVIPIYIAHFQNYNNYAFHLSVHKNTAGSAGHEETFGQKMAADRLCRELVMECLEKLGHN
jgi:hypothetical protein